MIFESADLPGCHSEQVTRLLQAALLSFVIYDTNVRKELKRRRRREGEEKKEQVWE